MKPRSTIPLLTDEEAKAAVLAWDPKAKDEFDGTLWLVKTGSPNAATGHVSRGQKSEQGNGRDRATAWCNAVDYLVLFHPHLWVCHTCKRIRRTDQMARSKTCIDCATSKP